MNNAAKLMIYMESSHKDLEKTKEEVFVGSGNVFEDLGYPNAEEALAKAKLAHLIHKTIKSRKLTQEQAAEILGIDQPKVSDIIRGKLSRYSIDRLMRFLRILGKDIEIHVGNKTKKSHSLSVVEKNQPNNAVYQFNL